MGRRFFIALGSGRYRHLAEDEQLHSVPSDVRSTRELFTAFDYEPVLSGLGEYDGAEQIRQKLSHWSEDAALTSDDVVVVYFAGHGSVEERDRHYLLCWDSHDGDVATTALATEDLVRILCRGNLRHLLLILDTCAGSAGARKPRRLRCGRSRIGTRTPTLQACGSLHPPAERTLPRTVRSWPR